MDDQELRIRIQTIADSQGLQVTAQQLDAITGKVRQAATATDQAAGSFKGFTEAQKQAAQEAVRMMTGTKDTAKALGDVEQGAYRSGRALYGLREIIGGLQNSRPSEFFRGIFNVLTSIGATVQGLVAAFSAAAVAAGPLVVAILAMKDASKQNEKAMQAMWDAASAKATAHKAVLEQVAAAAKKDLDSMIQKVDQLKSAYDELNTAIGRAEKRRDELDKANKELELAKAETPEQKAAIEAKYAASAASDVGTRAFVREKAATETLGDVRSQREAAASKVRDAQARFDNLTSSLSGFDLNTPGGVLAQQKRVAEAQAAKAELDAAKANAAEVEKRLAPIALSATRDIEDATTAREVGKIRQQTLSVSTAKSTAKTVARDPEEMLALRLKADAAQSKGDWAGQAKAVAELRNLQSTHRELTQAVVNTGATTSAALKDAARKLKTLDGQMKNLSNRGTDQ